MFRLSFVVFITFFIVYITANDGGLSDIPFNGTPDDVEDAFRTKLAVELAEKGKIPIPDKNHLSAVIVAGSIGIGGGGARGNSRPAEINIAGAGSPGDGTKISLEKIAESNPYSSAFK